MADPSNWIAVRAISTLARTVFFKFYLISNELQPTDANELKPLPGERMLRKTTAISLKCVKNCITFSITIESFRHKGLQALFEKGTSAKVQKALAERALRRLDAIDTAKTPDALNVPGFDFHGLQGKPKRFSVHGKVRTRSRSTWKITTRSERCVNVVPPTQEPSCEKMCCPACLACR